MCNCLAWHDLRWTCACTHCGKIQIFVKKIKFSIIPFFGGKIQIQFWSRFRQNWIIGQKLRFCISVFTFNISYSSSSEENSSNIKKSSSINSKENKSAKELKSMKNPTSNLPKPSSSKPRATPTKIQERRPPITNKNLNNLKKSNR